MAYLSILAGVISSNGTQTMLSTFSPLESFIAVSTDGNKLEGWYAPPLNARSPAVRPWTVEELHVYLRTGLGPQHAAAAGPMAGVAHALALLRGSQHRRAALAGAGFVDPGVLHDAKHPAVEARPRTPLAAMDQRPLNRRLGEVVGVGAVARQGARQPPQARQELDDLVVQTAQGRPLSMRMKRPRLGVPSVGPVKK